MEQIYVFLIRNDIWIYILSSFALIWYLSQFLRARAQLRKAMFGLEVERGRRMLQTSLIFIILLAAIIAAVAYVNYYVAPTLPPDLLRLPTPTPNPFSTPFPTQPAAGTPQATSTLNIAATVTLPGDSSVTGGPEVIEPTATASPTPIVLTECSDTVNISAPPSGVSVSGPVTFFGTATADEFGSYSIQAIGPQTGNNWLDIITEPVSEPVIDGILGTANLGNWLAGLYTIRLLVVDTGGEEVGQCLIQISLEPTGS